MANPTTTKKFPDQIRYFWETVKFTGSDAVLDVLRGDKDCKNMWVPDSNTVNIDAHVKYGHLYTDSKIIQTLIDTIIQQFKKSVAIISWDFMTVREWLTYGQNGYIYGLDTGPISHTNFLRKEITEEELASKVVVFNLIDILGNYSYTVACFVIPNKKNKQLDFIIQQLKEIDKKWSIDENVLIVGSVADGDFLQNKLKRK